MRILPVKNATLKGIVNSGMKKVSKLALPKEVSLPNKITDDVSAKSRSVKNFWDSYCGSVELNCTILLSF